MRAEQRALAPTVLYDEADPAVAHGFGRCCLGVEQHFHTVLAQDLADLLGDVGILARHELRGALDDRHLASEALKHLPELEPDISAPEDQEVLG